MGLDLSRGPRQAGWCSLQGGFYTPFRASGRKLEKFTVSVNVAAGSKVTFELTYEELLKRHKGKYEMFLKVQPKQLVKHFEVINPPADRAERTRVNVQVCGVGGGLQGRALDQSAEQGRERRGPIPPRLRSVRAESQRRCLSAGVQGTRWQVMRETWGDRAVYTPSRSFSWRET